MAEAITMRRGGTQGRHQERGSAPPLAQLRRVIRRIPAYDYFTAEGPERIHQASMTIPEEIGVEFRDSVALDAWRKARAKLAGERVHIDRGLLMELLAKAPGEFIRHARNPERSVTVGGRNIIFVPTYGSPFHKGKETPRRDIDTILKRLFAVNDLRNEYGLATGVSILSQRG